MSGLKSSRERAHARVGTLLKGKWQLEALLGVGGTAAVYAATHRNGKRAAIKILHPELSLDDDLVGRFLREGYAANRLDHPGAVSVLDDDRTEDGAVYLVMELLDGVSLERFTRANGERMPLQEIVRVADELLDVLAAAHAKGVVHRDIKPANLFLTRSGQLKVLDFGIARLTEGYAGEATATQTGAAIGTPAFMPPEQARGRSSEIDARTDVWAAGATIFALTSGRRPRRAETVNEELLMAMTQPVPPLASVAPSVPPELCAVVDRACAFDKQHRWRDAREMQLALRQAAQRLAPVVAAAPTMPVQPDPVAVGSEALDLQLTTSRPLVRGGPTDAITAKTRAEEGPSKRNVMLVAFVATLAFGGAALAVFVHMHAPPAAAAYAPTPRAEPSAAAPSAEAAARPETAPPAAMPPATTEPAATQPATTAPAVASASASASTSTSTPPHATTAREPHRTEPHARPASSGGGSMFDQRF